jgi:hypothetical protein
MAKITFSRQLAADGFSPNELARMRRTGELVQLRRGAYTEPANSELSARLAHLQLLRATVPLCSPDAVVSHTSAAVLHDLPVWTNRLDRVHLTRDRAGGGRTRRYVQVHGSPLARDEIVELDGFAATSLARTVVDLGCLLPLHEAVAAGDAALVGIDRSEIELELARQSGRTGIGKARRAAALLDPRSESAGESYSRVVFHLGGLPAPDPQYHVFTDGGRLAGRADFGWEEFRTLGEFDGKAKYSKLLRKPGQTMEDVLFAEKKREERLRELGWQVVRWIWADLYRPDELLQRLRAAFERGRRR